MGKKSRLREMQEEQERFFSNYTMTRNGIRDHIQAGRFTPFSFGIYEFLKLYALYEYAVNYTNAQAVATTFSCGTSLRSVQEAFLGLRKNEFIDYPEGGFGKGRLYPVLILKGEPTQGVLKGSRLIGFTDKTYQTIMYEFPNADRAQAVLEVWAESSVGGGADCAYGWVQDSVLPVCVGVSLQDIRLGRQPKLIRLEKFEDRKTEEPPNPAPSLEHAKSAHGGK